MTAAETFDDLLAAERRDAGMERADDGSDPWWRDGCDRAIREMARRGVVFTAYDLVELCGEPERPNQWGPRLAAAARAGVIKCVGYGPSRRPSTACSAVRLWRGAQ